MLVEVKDLLLFVLCVVNLNSHIVLPIC
jgi:hypothetical protein